MGIPLVDLHCHILPGLDDGAAELEISMQMLHQQVQQGVAAIAFTPHYNYERLSVSDFVKGRNHAFRLVADAARKQGVEVLAKTAAEVYYTTALPSLPLEKLAFYQTKYLLIELPVDTMPPGVSETLYKVQQQGFVPILAHVERYRYIEQDPQILFQWVRDGALAQINADGLLRGGKTEKRERQYIECNLVHMITSDCHSATERAPNLGRGMARLDSTVAQRLQKNARAVFFGEELITLEPALPAQRKKGWFAR